MNLLAFGLAAVIATGNPYPIPSEVLYEQVVVQDSHVDIEETASEIDVETIAEELLTAEEPIDVLETEEESIKEEETESEWVSLGEFKITAYCGETCCNGKWAGQTSTGVRPTPHRTIAVAPWIIPYGTEVRIDGLDYTYVAEDTGGFANHNDHQIDILMKSHSATCNWGVQYLEVWIRR